MKKTLLFLMALLSASFAFSQTVIMDLDTVTRADNATNQQGWKTGTGSFAVTDFANAKYMVIETNGLGDDSNTDGFGGIQFIFQGGGTGTPASFAWTQVEIVGPSADGTGNFLTYPREDGKTVSIAINLANVINSVAAGDYDGFLQLTDWLQLFIGYYSGSSVWNALNIQHVYLTNDFAKPADAVDLTGGTDFGFVFDGSVNDLSSGGCTPAVASSEVPGVELQYEANGDGWTGVNIFTGNDFNVWPWTSAGSDGAVAFTPVKGGAYTMTFNFTTTADMGGGMRVRWITNDSYGTNQADPLVEGMFGEGPEGPGRYTVSADDGTVADGLSAYFSGDIPSGATRTYTVNFTMDDVAAFDNIGSIGIRGGQGSGSYVINTIQITDANGCLLVNYDASAPVSVDQVQVDNVSQVYNIPGGIKVVANNENVSVYAVDGRLVQQIASAQSVNIPLQKGLYVVKVGAKKATKVVVQ